jgi:hypothetical protein
MKSFLYQILLCATLCLLFFVGFMLCYGNGRIGDTPRMTLCFLKNMLVAPFGPWRMLFPRDHATLLVQGDKKGRGEFGGSTSGIERHLRRS